MAKRTPYDQLALIPYIVAETVCGQEYTSQEISPNARCGWMIEKTEKLRKAMTPEMVKEFATTCHELCRLAYECRAEWFMKCVNGNRGRNHNAGRDQLYVWLRHWMAAYLDNPDRWREQRANDLASVA